MKGSTSWVFSEDVDGSTIVHRYVGIGLFEKFHFSWNWETGLLEYVYVTDKDDILPNRLIEYDGENVMKMTVKQDDDQDGEFELNSTQEYEYDTGENPDRGNPELYTNPYGGSGWSKNNANEAHYTDSRGNMSSSERTFEYNEYGYPISETVNGKTSVYEYNCKE